MRAFTNFAVALSARNNGFAGVWVQSSNSFQLMGTSTVVGNAFAGVTGIDSTGLMIDGAGIDTTSEAVRISGVRTVRGADGIHLINGQGAISNANLSGNSRVGMLLELGGASTDTVAASNIQLDGTGTALGAIAQNGMIVAGWDSGFTRMGDTIANDAAFMGALDAASAVGPVCFPPLDRLETGGISTLITP